MAKDDCWKGRDDPTPFVAGVPTVVARQRTLSVLQKVTELSGQVQWVDWQDRRLAILPLFHPAAALRARDLMPRLEEAFRSLGALLRELGPAPSRPVRKNVRGSARAAPAEKPRRR